MKLTKNQVKTYLFFLNEYKHLVGLSDWVMDLNQEVKDNDGSYATVIPDIFEKKLLISINSGFLNKVPIEQMNILFHELVHSRVLIMKQKIDEFLVIEEEHLVNDLVRGFETGIRFKFKTPKKVKLIKLGGKKCRGKKR